MPERPASVAMKVTDTQKPQTPSLSDTWHLSSAPRVSWLHLCSRRVPSALLALSACAMAQWASLTHHWALGTGNAAHELPMILQGCAAGIITITTHSPFGEPEQATGRWLPFLRGAMVLALCGAAIGFFALGAATSYNPRADVYLAGGSPSMIRNVLGMTGIGLVFCLVTGSLIAWIGPLVFTAISQIALIANYSEPLTWPTRSPTDMGGWIAAIVVFVVGLSLFTIRNSASTRWIPHAGLARN
jgi:hypothetical protein